ncbi:PH domain-containing protein [Streptomyces boninensis]|uniref:PH domain-containing protein n=1 Tax=Streptomyces boninensis TaxID=2039455 RepID=UPI003B2111C7
MKVSDLENGRRLHWITPWRRAWAPVAALAAFAVRDFEQARTWITELSVGWLVLAFVVLLPVAVAYGFLSWWYTGFAVTETELRVRTGLLFRRTAHIRLDRIQAIDVSRPLFARLTGVSKLKLDVVGTEKKDELAFLGVQDAAVLRAELLARSAGNAPGSAPDAPQEPGLPGKPGPGAAPARRLYALDRRTLVLSVLLSGSCWSALAGLAVVPALLWIWTGSPWAVIGAGLPLTGWVWSASGNRLLTEYGWTIDDSADGLRLDHGLLDRDHATVPLGRVQAVTIAEPLLWRRRRWVRITLGVAGQDKEKGGLLLPVGSYEDAERVLARVLPGVDLAAARACTRGVPRAARWCAPLWWRGYGHGVTESVFVVRRGLLRRSMTLVPHAKVQSVRLTQGPWERRLGLADIHVEDGANATTAARLRPAAEATAILYAQADRSRTLRRTRRSP